jgi:alkylation response protein AidB-like acyl-CoA dehydrogenase
MKFTEEQLAFRDGIRRMVERHVAPIAAEIDETDRFPTELLPIYGDMGLMQLWVPERYGGPEGNLTLMCIAREEISRVSPACGSIAGLNTMFIMPLLHFGTEEQRARFLPRIAQAASSRRSRSRSRRPAPMSARCRRAPSAMATATSSTAASSGAATVSRPSTSC